MEEKNESQMFWGQGSITVFLTLILALILALVTVSIEHVRFLTANSHVLMAADSAAMTVYGNYNKELYEEYGLFAYGGYNGIALEGFLTEFQNLLRKNLLEAPADNKGDYAALYRITNISAEAEDVVYLTDEEVFYQQIKEYLKAELLSDSLDRILSQFQTNTADIDSGEMQKNLDATSRYEHGEFSGAEEESVSQSSGVDNAESRSDSQSPEADHTEGNEATEKTEEEVPIEDHAGGNPLESFRELLRDGMLSLVCDEGKLSGESVEACYSNPKQESRKSNPEQSDSAADILKGLLSGEPNNLSENALLNGSTLKKTEKKGKLLCYAEHMFSYFTDDKNKTLSYGLEYLASGEIQERDNLQEVIQKILIFRIVMNYLYAKSDPSLQSESLATATSIAAALAIPALVTAIQQTILLILSVEESFIDITALLEGRSVPLTKDISTFQMRYSEICTAGKVLFQQKAKKYGKESAGLKAGLMTYQQYLMLLLLFVPEKTLRLRSYDLIQYDLQKRFNSSFSLEQSSCGIRYQIVYDMPFVFADLLQHDGTNGVISRSLSGCYQYQ